MFKTFCICCSNGLPQIHVSRYRRNTQPYPSCVSASPVTNVDLFACFTERLFININHPQVLIDRAGALPAIVCM